MNDEPELFEPKVKDEKMGNAVAKNAGQAPTVERDNGPVNLLEVIRDAASNPAMDVEKMERLMAMHERIVAKQAEAHFNAALSKVQGETHRVAADLSNSQTKSKYASYAALDRALRPIYTREGLALSFDTGEGAPPDWVRVLCYVSHCDGHTRTYHADIPADGKGAKGGDVMTKTHAAGSAFTYGQRYLLKMIFNVAIGQDDDGNSAAGGLITAEQKDELIELIRATESDTGKFLAWAGCATVDELPAKKFNAAKDLLVKKASQPK